MTTKEKWLSFDCFIIKQGDKAPEIATFAIDAYTLDSISTVSRITDPSKGYQRIINPRRLVAIRRFVEIEEAILPTSIVLATGDKPDFIKISSRTPVGESGRIWSAKLKIKQSPNYKPLLVIDGQHRLCGIISSKHSPYPVPVTLLLGANRLVQMAHFEVINNKATRIPAAHLNELRGMMFDLSESDESKLNTLLGQLGVRSLSASALVSELNGPNMIFEDILDFPSNTAGFVSSNTLRGLIDKSRSSGFLKYLQEDADEHLRAYNALWVGVSQKFAARWKLETDLFQRAAAGEVKKNTVKSSQRLLHSASISVIGSIVDNELASSTFRKEWLENPAVIAKLVQRDIFSKVPTGFWDDPNLSIDNTSKGRDTLRRTLEEQML
jgi:DGQHR domain-containing protein